MDMFYYNEVEASVSLSQLFVEQGNQALSFGHYLKAKNYYEQALELIKDHKVYHNLGVAYVHLDDYEKALNCYKKALDICFHRETLRQYVYVTNLLEDDERMEKILNLYSEAFDVHLWYMRGRLCQRKGENKKAFASYEHVLALDEEYEQVYPYLIQVGVALGLDEKLKKYLVQFKNKKPMVYYQYLSYYDEIRGNYESALEHLMKIHEKTTTIYSALARLYKNIGHYNKAVLSLEEAIQKGMSDPSILYQLSQLYKRTGQRRLYKKIMNELVGHWIETYRLQRT